MENKGADSRIEQMKAELDVLADNADMILEDYQDYFKSIDRKMTSVLKRVEDFIGTIKELSQEELCMECYSCFIQVMHLSVLLDIYQDKVGLFLVTGRETKNEDWARKIHNLLHEFRNNLFESRVAEAKEGGIEAFSQVQTAFDYGYAWARKAEAKMKEIQDELVNGLSGQEKLKYNYQAMATLTECGFTPEFFDAVGISATSSIRNSKIAFIGLDDKKAEQKMRHIHNQVLGESLMYPLLFQNILTHVKFMLGEMGWEKLVDLGASELLLRLNVHRHIYCGQEAVKTRINDLIALELYDEGEDIDKDKVREVKKRISVMCKSNPIMKIYRQHEDGHDLVMAIVNSKPTIEMLEEFYFYYAVDMKLDEYLDLAKEPEKPVSQINIDKNFAPLIDNHDGGLVDATALMSTMQKLLDQMQQPNK